MKHSCGAIVTDFQFCPYEDVLGVGHENGFTSLLIPGNSLHFFNLNLLRITKLSLLTK